LGRSLHALVVKACVEGNIFVGSALIDLYEKCGSIKNADLVFNMYVDMHIKATFTWLCVYLRR
jgi:hypothetical protein